MHESNRVGLFPGEFPDLVFALFLIDYWNVVGPCVGLENRIGSTIGSCFVHMFWNLE